MSREQAGEAVLLAAVTEYREQMRLLPETGEGVMRRAAALEFCLCRAVDSGAE